MPHVLLYEINTRCWLNELSTGLSQPITLANVPDAEFQQWKTAGFTHIWLMGVWNTGPKGVHAARSSKGLSEHRAELLPEGSIEDIGASPYAIAGYQVAPEFGGEDALRVFRGNLHRYNLKLILDFIPNHVGLDHPWLLAKAHLFVPGAPDRAGCFPAQQPAPGKGQGTTPWIAHGKDPYFAPWEDTAQLDYRVPETRQVLTSELVSVAERCDGVRCDMAMLVLRDVFTRTWADWPRKDIEWQQEFWPGAIAEARRAHPAFLFLAEAYWGLEQQLCSLGFDYAYDKTLYDHLLNRDAAAAGRHLYGKPAPALRQSAFFLENHDERRVASALDERQHRAAAFLILALPGLILLHEGQLTGRKARVPVQFRRRPAEPVDPAVKSLYAELLPLFKTSRAGRAEAKLLRPEPTDAAAGVIAVLWTDPSGADLFAINLNGEPRHVTLTPGADMRAPITLSSLSAGTRLGTGSAGNLNLDLPPGGCVLVSFAGPAV